MSRFSRSKTGAFFGAMILFIILFVSVSFVYADGGGGSGGDGGGDAFANDSGVNGGLGCGNADAMGGSGEAGSPGAGLGNGEGSTGDTSTGDVGPGFDGNQGGGGAGGGGSGGSQESSPPPTPPSFSCTPVTLNAGSQTTCAWDCPDGTTSAGLGFSTGGVNAGSAQFTPAATGDYGVQCSDGGQKMIRITVLTPSLSITANPTRVRSGNSSNITWNATNVNSCAVTGPNFSASGTSGGPQSTGALTFQSTYTLLCQTDTGPVSASVTVTLIPSIIETGE